MGIDYSNKCKRCLSKNLVCARHRALRRGPAKRKAKKPRDFCMPHSGCAVAEAATGAEKYFQLHASGSTEAKTARKLAAWLIRVAEWMENK